MLTKNNTLELDQRIEIQRARIRRMEYQTIGLLSRIILDADANSACPEIERSTIGRRIEFMMASFPVALSEDHADLLLPGGLPRQLPKIPDPRWPGASFIGEKTPYIEQLWHERASATTVVGGREFLVFRPINCIELRNIGVRFFKGSCWPKVRFMPDFNGDHAALLFDPEAAMGYITGGRFLFDIKVAVNREALKPVFTT